MDQTIEQLLKNLAADALKQQEALSKKHHTKKLAEFRAEAEKVKASARLRFDSERELHHSMIKQRKTQINTEAHRQYKAFAEERSALALHVDALVGALAQLEREQKTQKAVVEKEVKAACAACGDAEAGVLRAVMAEFDAAAAGEVAAAEARVLQLLQLAEGLAAKVAASSAATASGDGGSDDGGGDAEESDADRPAAQRHHHRSGASGGLGSSEDPEEGGGGWGSKPAFDLSGGGPRRSASGAAAVKPAGRSSGGGGGLKRPFATAMVCEL